MSNITATTKKPMEDIVNQIKANLHNPSAAFYAGISALEEVTSGNVTFLDPTNPTVLLLESASAASSAALTEALALSRTQYPNLAETPEDLYPQMSDWDYANRFASPCKENITMLFGWDTLKRDMVRDDTERCVKAIIPRDTAIGFGSTVFTLMYPIVIRLFDTGTLTVSYDASIVSRFQFLSTNIIPYEVNSLPTGDMFLSFTVEMLQLAIQPVINTIQSGRVFQTTFNFIDQFYYCRAFLRNGNTLNRWEEIKTTHTDLVYDRREPTLVLRVEGSTLKATLPQIYLRNNRYVGEIMLLVYTTKGDISENLSGVEPSFDLIAHDTERDLSDFTTLALTNVPRLAQSNAFTTGGTNGLSFEQLRSRVINNTVGIRQTPITNVDFIAEGEDLGFEIVKNTDVVTNRIFLATKKLPPPTNSRLTTSANIGIETLVTEKSSFENNTNVKINGDRWVITPTSLFEQVNGVMRILSSNEIHAIRSKPQNDFVELVNSRKFLYTPFHWVLDNESSEFSSRAYYMDSPSVSPINFVSQNQTLALPVNTDARVVERTPSGYVLITRVISGNHYKALGGSEVAAQLRFTPNGSTLPVFILGRQIGIAENGEREFAFDIKTNFNIDPDDQIEILDADYGPGYNLDIWTDLEVKFELFLCTNSLVAGYQQDEAVNLFGAFQMPPGFVPITHESLKITFGKSLKNLWSRARSLTIGYEYETHQHNIPRLYPEDVYDSDPVTGRLFTVVNGKPVFNILHRRGDPVLVNGQPVYEFKIGDPVIDPTTGKPKLKPETQKMKEVDLLMIDGRHYFVNDPAYISYNQELVNILLSWITEDLVSVQEKALEQTKVYFHPMSKLGECSVDRGDGIVITIPTEQSPVLDLYVPLVVYNDPKLRLNLETKAIKFLDETLSSKEINKTKFEKELADVYGNSVTSLKLGNIGGDLDLHFARVTSPNKRLTLKRILVAQPDGTFIMKEDVSFNFIKVKD